MLLTLLFAQAAATSEQTVSLLERILQGGVPLICLAIAVICGVFAYWQLRRNNALEHEFRNAIKAEAEVRLVDQAKLMREMLDRDRQSHEAQVAAVQVVESFTAAQRDAVARLDAFERALRGCDLRPTTDDPTARRRSA